MSEVKVEVNSDRRVTRSQTRKRQLELDNGTSTSQGQAGSPTPSLVGSSSAAVGVRGSSGDVDTDNRQVKKLKSRRTKKTTKKDDIKNQDQGQPQTEKSKELRMKVMNNDLIIAKISKTLSAGSLRTLRRTCGVWNNNFVPQWKKKHGVVPLVRGSLLGLRNLNNPKIKGPDDLIKIFESSRNVPFTRYEFKPENAKYRPDDCQDFQRFVVTFGNTITRLDLEVYQKPLDLSFAQLRRLIFQLTPQLSELNLKSRRYRLVDEDEEETYMQMVPRLKRLRMLWADFNGHAGGMSQTWSRLLSDLLKCASRLEFLELDYGNYRRLDDFVHPITHINSLPHVNKLKSIVLSRLQPQELQVLVQLAYQEGNGGLRLESLSMPLDCSVEYYGFDGEQELRNMIQLFHDFLTTQSSTLKELTLRFDRQNDYHTYTSLRRIPLRYPRMERLACLKVEGSGFRPDEMELDDGGGTGTFENTFPNLVSISILEWAYLLGQDDVERLSHPGVKELEVQADATRDNMEKFMLLGHAFPSVVRLELGLSRKLDNIYIGLNGTQDYAKVWTIWPALISLKLTGDIGESQMDFDTFLTGIPRRRLKFLKQNIKSTVAGAQSSETLLASLQKMLKDCKRGPGISDLKQLKDITMDLSSGLIGFDQPEIEARKVGYRLTDIGAYLGVALANPSLQRVSIAGNSKNVVSKQCRAFISEILGSWVETNL